MEWRQRLEEREAALEAREAALREREAHTDDLLHQRDAAVRLLHALRLIQAAATAALLPPDRSSGEPPVLEPAVGQEDAVADIEMQVDERRRRWHIPRSQDTVKRLNDEIEGVLQTLVASTTRRGAYPPDPHGPSVPASLRRTVMTPPEYDQLTGRTPVPELLDTLCLLANKIDGPLLNPPPLLTPGLVATSLPSGFPSSALPEVMPLEGCPPTLRVNSPPPPPNAPRSRSKPPPIWPRPASAGPRRSRAPTPPPPMALPKLAMGKAKGSSSKPQVLSADVPVQVGTGLFPTGFQTRPAQRPPDSAHPPPR